MVERLVALGATGGSPAVKSDTATGSDSLANSSRAGGQVPPTHLIESTIAAAGGIDDRDMDIEVGDPRSP